MRVIFESSNASHRLPKYPFGQTEKKRRSSQDFTALFFTSPETLTGSSNKLLDAAAVFVGTGVDFDLVARVHESGNVKGETGGQTGGLHHLAGRVALDGSV